MKKKTRNILFNVNYVQRQVSPKSRLTSARNSIIEGLSPLVTEARFYIEHLQMQLNMLTLGHLSPNVISPKNLRSLLIGIASKLPPGILLTTK